MSKKTILVVEDNDFVRMQLCRFLSDDGFNVIESTDGQSALDLMGKEKVDAAIVDIRMEPINGFNFVSILRGNGDHTPVLIVTGDDNTDILQKASKLGIATVLKKPVQKERLIKTISRILHIEK